MVTALAPGPAWARLGPLGKSRDKNIREALSCQA
jgi:hypothetical protein